VLMALSIDLVAGRAEGMIGVVDHFDPARMRRTYDAVAEEYDATFGDDLQHLPFDRQFLDDFAALAPKGRPVVEVGCGPGQASAYLADRGVEMIGVDLAPRMLQVARRRHPHVRVVAGDVRRLPLRAGSCAGVVAFYSLPFVKREQLPLAVAELRRVLPAGGMLGLAVHLGQGEVYGADQWLGHEVEPIAMTLFEEGEIADALDRASFRPDETRQREPLPHERQGPRIYVLATVVAATGPS